MDTLQNFIPQLGYGFVCSFWQMGLLFALYKLAASVYLSAPSERFRFAFFLVLAGSIWFVYTIASGKPSGDWQLAAGFTQHITEFYSALFYQSMYWLGCAYLFLLAFASIKGHLQWKATRKIMKSGQGKAPVEWRIFSEKHAALLGIKKKVILKISGTFSPATFGFLKPVILLPASCLTGLTTAQLQAILLHELAHIRRGDYLAAWVMQVAGILLYFNPFMRQLIREAKMECEHACDDLVMQFEYNPLQYAQALLSVAKNGQNMAWVLPAQGSSQPPLLLNRITRMLGRQNRQFSYSWKGVAIGILAIALFYATKQVKNSQKQLSIINTSAFITTAPPVQEAQQSWEQYLIEARTAIYKATANKLSAIQNTEKEAGLPMAQMEEPMAKNEQAEERNAALISQATQILAANRANEQQIEASVKEMEMAWKHFNLLLEKLDLMGDLEENEWKQIAGLITLHADIRVAIYEESNRSQNLSTRAAAIASEQTGKVLVIVHDETTGKLAASFRLPDEINATYTEEALPENRQQVILLRKKAATGKKIISL